MNQVEYQCSPCRKKLKSQNGTIPLCCGQPMKQIKLDVCTKPHSAEYSGPYEEDEPCDDGRAG